MLSKNKIKISALSLVLAAAGAAADGGVSIQGTRIVYGQGVKQERISVKNSSKTDSFLVESWVEDAEGNKSNDFIVTPPLFLSSPKNENMIRLMYVGGNLPKDKEKLYYFISKEIPSIDEMETENKNVLRIAAASKIKLFVRPSGLNVDMDKAITLLSFTQAGKEMDIYNPSPYFITLTDINYGGGVLKDVMVGPQSHTREDLPAKKSKFVSFRTINDYGAVTTKETMQIK